MAALEPAIASADPARRRPDDRLRLAAGRISASDVGIGIRLATTSPKQSANCNDAPFQTSVLPRCPLRKRTRLSEAWPRLHRLYFQRKRQFDLGHRHRQTRSDQDRQSRQRPRGIELSKDGKELYICAGDDDTINIIDTKTFENIGDLPSGADPELLNSEPRREIYLYVERERQPCHRDRCRDTQASLRRAGWRRARRHGGEPRRQDIINTSETTNMAHFIDLEKREIVANVLVDARPALRRLHAGCQGALGLGRGRRYGERHRRAKPYDQAEDHIRGAGPCQGGDPTRWPRPSRRTARKSMPRWGRRTASPSSTWRRRRSKNIFSSASASGIWL